MFPVEISKVKNVSILKDEIKKKKAAHLNHVAASDVDLWKVGVCLLIDDPTSTSKKPLKHQALDSISQYLRVLSGQRSLKTNLFSSNH